MDVSANFMGNLSEIVEDRYQMYSRDACRAPMQWDDSPQAGFSTSSKTWLPAHPNYKSCNVKVQSDPSRQLSSLKIYQMLARLRQSPVFLLGDLLFATCTEEIFSYVRQHPAHADRYLIAMNVGKTAVEDLDLTSDPVNASSGEVLISSQSVSEKLSIGQTVELKCLSLKPGDGVVVKLQ